MRAFALIVGLSALSLGVAEGAAPEWRQTVAAFCQAAHLPPLLPVRSVPLKDLATLAPVAFGWELRSAKGRPAWAVVSLDGQLWELGFGAPWWQRWEKPLKEKILTRYGAFLADGTWHWLYRGLGGYGGAIQKGMTVRVEARTLDLWGDGRKDGVFSAWARETRFKGASNPLPSLWVAWGFPVLPTLRSSHATAAAMWALGEKLALPKEPPPALVGALAGVITRCLCEVPERPWVHELERGIPLFLQARGRNGVVRSVLRSEKPFAALPSALRRAKSALVTFTYLTAQVKKDAALQRTDGTTVLAVGYWVSPSAAFLIALPPLPPWETGRDKVAGWGDGVTLYRWDGPATNVVVTLVALTR